MTFNFRFYYLFLAFLTVSGSESFAGPFVGVYVQPRVQGYTNNEYYSSLSGTGFGGNAGWNFGNFFFLEVGFDRFTFAEQLCTDEQELYQQGLTYYAGARLYPLFKIIGFHAGYAMQNKTRRLFWRDSGEEILSFSYDFDVDVEGAYFGPSVQFAFPKPVDILSVYADLTFRPEQDTLHFQLGIRATF